MLSATQRFIQAMGMGFLLLGLCVLTGGCGGKETADVSGKVVFKDKPLEFGSVNLFASDDKPYMGEIKSDGTYTVKKVPVGPARVSVECTDPKVREDVKNILKPKPGPDGKMPPKPTYDPKKLHVIPEAYNDPGKSGLRVDVKGPATTFDISLNEKGPG